MVGCLSELRKRNHTDDFGTTDGSGQSLILEGYGCLGLNELGMRDEMIWFLQWAARQPSVDIIGVAALAPLLVASP